jgi:acetoacetyl-CoA synthetase
MKHGVEPRDCGELGALETILATGSPLSPEAFRWIYARVKSDLWLSPISGGTDIAGGFLVGTPTLPVFEGEMQCRNLGCAVYAFDEAGRAVTDTVGELVCTRPMPTMPLFLWNDPDGARLRESYFEPYRAPDGTPIWRHGDWLRLVPHESAQGGIIYGRSDATINRGGIRMGTAEFYRAVEAVPDVIDSLVVDLEYLGRESYLALFVVLKPERVLDPALEAEIRDCLRTALSARHVPDEIVQADAVPRNLTGKKLELPIKKILLGHPVANVVSRDAMANPQCLEWYLAFGESRGLLQRGDSRGPG